MKQFLIRLRNTVANILILLSLMKQLNTTIFQDNKITLKELTSWINIQGVEKTISDLKTIRDEHNHYDKETN